MVFRILPAELKPKAEGPSGNRALQRRTGQRRPPNASSLFPYPSSRAWERRLFREPHSSDQVSNPGI